MRAVVQRVSRAKVTVDGTVTGRIGIGLLVLLGISVDDTEPVADTLLDKIVDLRLFDDADGKMNFSLTDVSGSMLVVSQFTLYGDTSRGRRPSFLNAARPDSAKRLYEYFVARARDRIEFVETGVFQAMMDVELVNNGPVTLILDTGKNVNK